MAYQIRKYYEKMIKTPDWPSDNKLVGYLSKHFVPVYFTFKKEETTHSCYFSAFLIAIHDLWFLISAGHCMEDIDKNIQKGYQIERCRLIDSRGLMAYHKNTIPFDYVSAPQMHVNIAGLDYGVIYVNDCYKVHLEENNIKPLTEEVWEIQPSDPDFYLLLGVPYELSEVNDNHFHIITTLHWIEPLDHKPANFKETKAPMFYGKIPLGDTLTDIEGMSGGPIYACTYNEAGELRYWLHAVQSEWLRNEKYIAACLTTPFIGALKDKLIK